MGEERWEEGTVESSSPPRASGLSPTRQLRRTICDRLLSLAMAATPESDPSSFRDKLCLHFDRLPPSYLTDLGVDKAEDVLLHRRILDECADPERRPVFHARFLKYETAVEPDKEGGSNPDFSDDPCQKQLQDLSLEKGKAADNTASSMSISSRDSKNILLHEIIFSSLDKPKLLMRLTALLSKVGLNIREAHVYSTTDGFCLNVFVVDGWETEETDDLLTKIKETLTRKNVCVHKADDVLLHRRLLADCADPGKRPVVHARFLKCIQVAVDYCGGPEALPESRGRKEALLVHEIIFASIDKPKLLSQLSALLSEVGLNIREAHVYSTTDGFSLIIFLADGWCQEEADGLLKEIKETLARRQASPPSTTLERILLPWSESLSYSKQGSIGDRC